MILAIRPTRSNGLVLVMADAVAVLVLTAVVVVVIAVIVVFPLLVNTPGGDNFRCVLASL